jgi:hypothetical protein
MGRAEAGADRVVEHIAARRFEVRFVPDDPGGEPALEEMAVPGVASVETLRVGPVQLMHRSGQVDTERLDD